jgi:hypothetical protein
MYKLSPSPNPTITINMVQRLSDRAWIPFDPNNRDYQKYLAWLEEGNTPLPADPTLAEDK